MNTIALAALIVALTAPAGALGAAAEPGRLTLTFETSAPAGAVMVTLFDPEATYAGGARCARRGSMWPRASTPPSSAASRLETTP